MTFTSRLRNSYSGVTNFSKKKRSLAAGSFDASAARHSGSRAPGAYGSAGAGSPASVDDLGGELLLRVEETPTPSADREIESLPSVVTTSSTSTA